MPISAEHLIQFIEAWEAQFGERLAESDARLKLERLVELYRLTLRTPRRDIGDLGDVGDLPMPPPS
jgi:hypothetical protein